MTERTRGGVIRSIEFYFLCPGIRHRDLFFTRAETPALFLECARGLEPAPDKRVIIFHVNDRSARCTLNTVFYWARHVLRGLQKRGKILNR
jgi:hypothetical protein